jgi:hypothetical protein
MAAVSKTANPSAPVVVGLFRSTKTGIRPLGFKVLMYHGSFCTFVRMGMCSTLRKVSHGRVQIRRTGSDALVCDFVAIDALQFLEMNRHFPPVGGALGVEDERRLGNGGHLSVN